MKANFTFRLKTAVVGLVFSATLIGTSELAKAQAPLRGGMTYYVDGNGTDLVAPKDTFRDLSGTYAVPAPPFACPYTTAYTQTTGILSALTINGTDSTTLGTVNIVLAAGYQGYVEPNPINVGTQAMQCNQTPFTNGTPVGGYLYQSGTQRPIRISPQPGLQFVITSNSVAGYNSLMRLSGIQYFTIDGEGTPGSRDITFRLPSTSTTSKVIEIMPPSATGTGCRNITIRNCNIIGSSTTGGVIYTHAGIFLGNGVSNTGAPRLSEFITIENNFIGAVNFGVRMLGPGTLAPGNQDIGLVIRNNTIGGTIAPGSATATDYIGGAQNAAGILLSAQSSAIVENNTIRNSIRSAGATGGFRGIALTIDAGSTCLDSNILINRNRIYNIVTDQGSFGSYGIRMSIGVLHSNPLKITMANNTIANIAATVASTSPNGMSYPIGISIEDNSLNSDVSIIHNSVNLYGNTLPSGGLSACFAVGITTQGGITMLNNIFANRMGRSATNTIGSNTYGIVLNTPNPFSSIDANNYYINTFDGGNAFMAYSQPTGKYLVSMNHWRTYLGFGEANSLTAIPPFVSDTLLELNNSTHSVLWNRGVSSGVTVDINGATRPTTGPSIGAYQFTSNPLLVNGALYGGTIYSVNGGTTVLPTVGTPAVGNFATMSEAISYVNAYGTTGAGGVVLEIGPNYNGEGNRYMPAFIDYPNASGARPVTIKTATGVADTLTIPNQASFTNCAVLRFFGARFVTVDGVNQYLTILMPPLANNATGRVISLAATDQSPTTDIIIQKCIITGSSTNLANNSFAGIYQGSWITNSSSAVIGNNNNNTFSYNLIQAVKYGIYYRGFSGSVGPTQDQNIYIGYNTIGGVIPTGQPVPTTYIGGGANSLSGIYLKGLASSFVDGNIVRNSIPSVSVFDFRGIDLDYGLATEYNKDTNIYIINNRIYNLVAGINGNAGIRINLGNEGNRRLVLYNNFIGKIQGPGASSGASIYNPTGILIDATAAISNIDIEMYHNTVYLSGNTLTLANSSTCLYIGSNINGGITMRNNLLVNRLGRTLVSSPTIGTAYAVVTANGTINPFLATAGSKIENNVYYAGALNTNNYLGLNGAAIKAVLGNYKTTGTWREYTRQDTNSYWHPVEFVTDTMPDVVPATAGPVAYGGVVIPSVIGDIYGTTRWGQPGYLLSPAGTAPCIGAVEFIQPYSPLVGGSTYYIDGINSPPLKTNPTVGHFRTLNRAFQYLVANGVEATTLPVSPVKIVITTGYPGEGDTLISPLTEYPKMNANRVVIFTTDSARTITTAGGANGPYTNAGSVIRFAGASYVTIDGSKNGTNSRDLTITLPSAAPSAAMLKVVDLVPGNLPSTNITVKNCVIMGNSGSSTINTFAGIYSGGISTVTPYVANPLLNGSNNNRFENNFIGGVRYGIYLRGLSFSNTTTPPPVLGMHDMNAVIRYNNIGGEVAPGAGSQTNYWGGTSLAAGIFLSAQGGALVDSNVIKNNINTTDQNRGIELSNVSGTNSTDSAITISRNIIYRLTSTQPSVWGIYMNLGTDSFRNVTIVNNWISGISSQGTASSPNVSMFNPAGIYVEGGSAALPNNFVGVNMWFNSINLGPGTQGITSVANSASSAIQFGQYIRGGVSTRNNIFQNRLSHVNSANNYGVLVGANQNIFIESDNNNYFVNGAGPGTNRLFGYNAVSSVVPLTTLDAVSAFTGQDTSSISFVTQFVSDTTLDLPLFSTSVLAQAGKFIASVPYDIFGPNAVPVGSRGLLPTIGAREFNGTPVDSVGPKIYNYTNPQCGNGPFLIDIRAYEKNIVSDTLYWFLDGVAQTPIPGTAGPGISRYYNLPAVTSNQLILYRVSLNDATGKNAKSPVSGLYDTISTVVSVFPYYYGFDGPNVNKWSVEAIPGFQYLPWIMGSYGSLDKPNFPTAYSGVKVAMFPSATAGSNNKASRLVTPCFDLDLSTNNMPDNALPTLRFWVTKNGDLPSQSDYLRISLSTGGGAPGTWGPVFGPTGPLTITRTIPSYPFPEWEQVDICLVNYIGFTVKIAIEGYSKAGNNIMIDSFMIFDNHVSNPVTPAVSTVCHYDSIELNIASSSKAMSYQMIDAGSNATLSEIYRGNGGSLKIKGPNPKVDSVFVIILAKNILSNDSSTCLNTMSDTSLIYIKLFKNGPFIIPGQPFSGAFNPLNDGKRDANGTAKDADGSIVGDTLTYIILPPSGLTNADFTPTTTGGSWTITSTSIKTITGQPGVNVVYTAPTPTSNGMVKMFVSPGDGDSTFYLNVKYRLLPTGCDSTVIRGIKVTSKPTSSFNNGGKDTACAGATTLFQYAMPTFPSNLPYTYVWDFGDGTTAINSGALKKYTTPGVYNVSLTVYNSANLSTTTNKTFTVLPSPTAAFVNSRPCSGDTVVFTNNSTGSVNNKWTYTSAFGNDTSNAVSPHFYLSTPSGDTGTFNVRLIAYNSLGCTDTSRSSVQLFAKPVASFTVTNHCLGTRATMVNASTIPGANNSIGSTWFMGNGDTTISANPTYLYPNNGDYTIRLHVTSNYGCIDSMSRQVTVYDKPRTGFTYDATTTCMYTNVVITDTSKYAGVLANNKMQYLWDFGDNSTPSTDFTPVHAYGAAGVYDLKIVAMDTVHYCKDSTVKTVTISTTPVSQFEMPNGACVNNPVAFTNKTAGLVTDSVRYLWNFGDTHTDTVENPTHVYTGPGSNTVSLKAMAKSGCNSTSSKVLPVSSSPVVSWSLSRIGLDSFTGRFIASASIYTTYAWTFFDGTGTQLAYRDTITHTFSDCSCWHKVRLTVSDANGCVGTYLDSAWIRSVGVQNAKVDNDKFGVAVYPNPFSDETNVAYTLDNATNVHISVFDMLGRMVADYDKGVQSAGSHTAQIGADKFLASSATYLVRIQIGSSIVTKQVVKQK